MISPKEDEYNNLITHRLDENWKSFNILLEMKHYGNCISIMCQELDQVIRVLFLLKSKRHERDQFINLSINSQKWFLLGKDNKKEYITDDIFLKFAETLGGWERSIYEFGTSFKSLSNNYNYLLKDPIISLNETERKRLYDYIKEYHVSDFPSDFSLKDIIPVLPLIFEKLSLSLRSYITQL